MLLHDWLVILIAPYNNAYKLVQYDNGTPVSCVDVAFLQCPQLQPLPRLVFALLRNPLLHFHEDGVHPDYRIYLHCLSVLSRFKLHHGLVLHYSPELFHLYSLLPILHMLLLLLTFLLRRR